MSVWEVRAHKVGGIEDGVAIVHGTRYGAIIKMEL